jgi:hypothetical protein
MVCGAVGGREEIGHKSRGLLGEGSSRAEEEEQVWTRGSVGQKRRSRFGRGEQ